MTDILPRRATIRSFGRRAMTASDKDLAAGDSGGDGSLRGLLLPRGVVQPFPLLYRLDDLHIMGVIDGHPKYEAVEAMIERRLGGASSIRAILTRHDQSQIDH